SQKHQQTDAGTQPSEIFSVLSLGLERDKSRIITAIPGLFRAVTFPREMHGLLDGAVCHASPFRKRDRHPTAIRNPAGQCRCAVEGLRAGVRAVRAALAR